MPTPRLQPAARFARRLGLAALAAAALGACHEGARIEARPQVITFGPAPTPGVNETTATVSATASSGLPVVFGSRSPQRCAVDGASGRVTATAAGTCTVSANQYGDSTWAAAQQATQEVVFTFRGTIAFGPPPSLRVFDLGTVTATESTGLPVTFASATPATCAVEPGTGLVSAITQGECRIVATAGGGDEQATLSLAIDAPASPTLPGAPSGVAATAGSLPGTASVRIGALSAGGSAVTGYTVSSSPPGLTATGPALPLTVDCLGSCAGYRFTVAAANAVGTGPASPAASLVTRYRVVATFREPDTQPNDSIFIGGYTYDASAGAVTGLRGELSESMTGGPVGYPDDTMTWIPLSNQLASIPVTLGGARGWLVTTFLLGTTGTLCQDPRYGGTDGWTPGTGSGFYFDYPGSNPGNAYVQIFVNADEPTAPAAQAQIDRIAYADCAAGGMMGDTCMTGTSIPGYGVAGTMGGTPVSQVTTRE